MDNTPELASLSEKALLDEATVAAVFKVSARTIKRWVSNGELPPPAQLGGRKYWMAGRILAHVEQRISDSEKFINRRRELAARGETP